MASLAGLGAGAALVKTITVFHGNLWAYVLTSLLGLATFGLTRPKLRAQIASRGVLLAVLGMDVIVLLEALFAGFPVRGVYVFQTLVVGAALLFGRPFLATEEAQRSFAPARFRAPFLAGATAVTAVALGAAGCAWAGVMRGSLPMVLFNATVAAALLASVRGVLALRTWGMLLGGATSLVLLALAPFFGSWYAFYLTLGALPPLAFWIAPLIVAARTRDEAPRVRIASATEDARVRLPDAEDDLVDAEPAPRRAARVCAFRP